MIDRAAEDNYVTGKRLLDAGRPHEALALLSAAVRIDEGSRDRTAAPQARYLSSYGLCLCLLRMKPREALHSCRQAVKLEGYRSSLWSNLGRVAFALNSRNEAFCAWQRGLALDPSNETMIAGIRRMGLRRMPVLSVVSRRHPLNILLGRFRDLVAKPLP